MTKVDLISLLEKQGNLPHSKAKAVVDTCFESIIRALYRDERVEIRGLGSFINRNYKSYVGRNPKTGKSVRVSAKKIPFFKAGKKLREAVGRGHKRFMAPGP